MTIVYYGFIDLLELRVGLTNQTACGKGGFLKEKGEGLFYYKEEMDQQPATGIHSVFQEAEIQTGSPSKVASLFDLLPNTPSLSRSYLKPRAISPQVSPFHSLCHQSLVTSDLTWAS